MLYSKLLYGACAGALMLSVAGVSGARADDTVNWTGLYLGIHAGGTQSDTFVRDLDDYNPAPSDFGYSTDGLMAGIQAGYNFQTGMFVIGVEGEIGYMGLSGTAQLPRFVGVRLPNDSMSSTDTGFYGTIAARLGLSIGNFLPYAKVGYGWVDTDVSYIDDDPSGLTLVSGTRRSKTRSGAVYGGGVEYMISPKMTVKVEYLRFDVSETMTVNAVDSVHKPSRFAHDLDDIDTVKIGLSIKFP